PSTAPSSAGAPLNLTSLLLHRRGLVRPKPGFLARFARQRPSDRDRRLLAGLAAAESSDPSSVYLSMLTCSFEFCRELFEPASGCDRLPQVGSAMTLPRGATTWGKYLADDPATFATMDQARWPVRGLCVVSDAYPYRRLLGMRFGRPPPGFRPVELVDVRAERHEVLTVEEPILQPEQQPSQPSPAAVDQLVKEQSDLVDTDYYGAAAAAATADTAAAAAAETADTAAASAASDADAIVGTGGASVFGKLLAMLNVKASSAASEQWDEFDAGFDCFDNPDAAAGSAVSYGFDDEKQLLRLQQRRRHESEGGVEAAGGGAAGSFEGLDFGLGFGGRRDRHGGAADEDDNDEEDEEGDGEEVGGSSGDEEPAAPLSVEEFSSQRALADYRLNELVSGLLASTSDRQPLAGPAVAEPPPAAGCGAPTSAAEEKAEDEDLPEQRRQRGRRVDLFPAALGYAQFCDKRVRRVHALLKRAVPDLRLPPTPEPLRPGLLDFDQLHERGLGCPDLLRWRLLPYDLTRCVAFVVLCCASVQPTAGCPFCSDSDARSGADDFNCGGGGSRRRRIKACSKEFNSEYRLRVHLHNVHPVESHQCGLCGHHFKRLYLLRNHMAAVHKEPLPASAVPRRSLQIAEVWDEISCEMCKKVFSSERLLAVHRQRVHGQTSESRCFPCPHCQASLKGKQNLLSHIKQIHVSPRATKECPVCQKQVRNLSDHVISQHKVRLKDLKVDCHDPASDAYQCGVCTLSFRMQHLLLQHRRASHPQLTCHNCGRIFDSSEAADEHLLICSASGGGGADGERKRKRKAAAAAAAAAAASTTGEGGIGGGGPAARRRSHRASRPALPVADADPAAGPAGGSGAAV
uniref:C2H2-type domain-containing protein n=1 Tax=Macrostomum lignano TaxID=282301 RepID=A0A1I8GER3_9PLAT